MVVVGMKLQKLFLDGGRDGIAFVFLCSAINGKKDLEFSAKGSGKAFQCLVAYPRLATFDICNVGIGQICHLGKLCLGYAPFFS